MTTRLVRQGAWELIAEHIKDLIFTGELRPGDRVPQEEIAARLGVSRIPVREALISLQHDGWLKNSPYRGSFVQAFDEEAIDDLHEAIGLVYGLVARRAARRATDGDIAALTSAQHGVSAAQSPVEMLAANSQFLKELHRIGGSQRITSMLRTVSVIVPGNFFEVVPEAIPIQRRGTAKTVKAIKARDGDLAAAAILTMTRQQGAEVLALLKERHIVSQTPVVTP